MVTDGHFEPSCRKVVRVEALDWMFGTLHDIVGNRAGDDDEVLNRVHGIMCSDT